VQITQLNRPFTHFTAFFGGKSTVYQQKTGEVVASPVYHSLISNYFMITLTKVIHLLTKVKRLKQ